MPITWSILTSAADEGSRGLAAGFLLTTALVAVKEAAQFMVGSQYSNAPASAG